MTLLPALAVESATLGAISVPGRTRCEITTCTVQSLEFWDWV